MNANDLRNRNIPSVAYTVVLIRNEKIGPRTWPHTSKASALLRAHALCELHNVREATFNDRTYTVTVDASAYYAEVK